MQEPPSAPAPEAPAAADGDIELAGRKESKTIPGPRPAPAMSAPRVMQPGRALVAWLPENQAVTLMLGHPPLPGEDTGPVIERLQRHREALARRAPFQTAEARHDELVDDDLRAVANRPEVRAAFAQVQWTPAVIDLTGVIAYQPVVNIGSLDDRVAPVLADRFQLIEFCLPSGGAQQLETIPDEQSVSLVSANPNLRVIGTAIRPEAVTVAQGMPPINAIALISYVYLGPSYMHVVRYRERYFLRDGYHRAAALVKAGINLVPCILVDATRYEEVVSLPGMIAEDRLLGDRPPSIADYWSDDVASEISTPVVKKIVRVKPDQFVA
jgi:hypothetical protein